MRTKKTELDGKTGIAKRLEITRTTLDVYLNQPGAPQPNAAGQYDVAAVSAWVANNSTEKTATKVDGDLRSLKARELRLKCERLQLKLEADRGLYYPRAEVSETVRQIAQTQKAVLQRKLESELPPKLLGLSVVEMTEAMKVVVDDVCRILNDRTAAWQ